ncbi:MAG: hypothetical protein KJ721_02580 [Nanoarchaeota archaeon]|nr:hypothetical protein [Nanoarchaeota archaeon]
MKFKFKKVASLLASGAMLVSTLGFAMAANYPQPFVVGSNADVAIVYGTGAGVSSLDLIQAGNIQTNLQSSLGTTSSGTSTSVSGEAYALFTSSSKIYMNESLNSVRSTLTDTELPTVLADGTFEGDVTADYTQTIVIGSTPRLVFGNHPTSDDDPVVAFSTGTSTLSVMYNMTVTFDQAVALNHTDSIGESMTIFGKQYTVGAGTTATKLYLYESSETVALSVGGSDPTSQTITVDGATYTIELTGASDTAATIKVTDSTGASQTKEITEDNSKKVQGIDVAVNLADEDTATNRLTAEVTVGANKILLQDGNKIKVGSDETSIDGTLVTLPANNDVSTGFTIGVVPDDSDVDALVVGDSFTDPVFGTLKIDFSSLYADDDRESIKIAPAGGDKATIEMTTHNGDTKKINWVYNDSVSARLADSGDSGEDKIHVLEGEKINITQYVVVGNEDEGYLLEFYQFSNDTDTRKDDIKFRDAFNTDDTYSVTGITTEGAGSLIVGGKTYGVKYYDKAGEGDDYVTLDYPDTTTADTWLVMYPTISTSKGAKVMFYEPHIDLSLNDPSDYTSGGALERLYFPDGDGYSYVTFASVAANDSNWTITPYPNGAEGTADILGTLTPADNVTFDIGEVMIKFNSGTTENTTSVYIMDAAETANEVLPGIVIFEEKDDNSQYQALIVVYDDKASASELAGIADVETTWNNDGVVTDWDEIQMEATDDDVYASYDLWGTLMLLDKSDSDQYSLEIQYPDEQVHAQVYVAEESASITAGVSGSTSTPLGEVLVKDSEVSSVATKNLVIIGGSCINSAAASLVGEPACGARFTELTGAGSGQFLIKGYSSSGVTSKVALLVAGYEAADTVNAAKFLTTQTVDTGKEYLGTSSTSATLVTATA